MVLLFRESLFSRFSSFQGRQYPLIPVFPLSFFPFSFRAAAPQGDDELRHHHIWRYDSDTLLAGFKALPAGSEDLPASSAGLQAGSKALSAGCKAFSADSKALPAGSEAISA